MSDAVFISRGGQSGILVGFRDLVGGLSRTELWFAFAADEVQQRYRRSRLGLAWIVVSYLLFVGSISVFFGGFSSRGAGEFTAYVAVCYALFAFLTANLTDGCAVFRSSRTWIKGVPLPHSIHVLKSVARGVFVFFINMSVAFVVLLVTGHLFDPIAWLAIPAFLILLINAVFVQTYLGYAAARFRDFEHLLSSMTRILFFTTPILWIRAEQPAGSLRRAISDVNPFTHALEIFSAPLLGHMPDPLSWKIIGILTVLNFFIMLGVAYVAHRRLPYWL